MVSKQKSVASRHKACLSRQLKRLVILGIMIGIGVGVTVWLGAWPWSAYAACGTRHAVTPPGTVRVGLYEEFPVTPRLERLRQLDFPVRIAVAAASREEFLRLKDAIQQEYPQVQETFFWPLLSPDNGYYPGTWSNGQAIEQIARDAEDLPVLWDLEWPRQGYWFPRDWAANRAFLDGWFRDRVVPAHIWRAYPAVSLHLELYATGQGLPDELLERVLRCGVERYGERFIPSLGILNDQEGDNAQFIPVGTLARYLAAARRAGVSEIWLFGVNGLNSDYIAAIRTALPLAPLSEQLARRPPP